LRLQHQKQFKANVKPPTPVKVTVRRRGAPVGHPGWRWRDPDHIDQVVQVAAPVGCPHCKHEELLPCAEIYKHVQEEHHPRAAHTRHPVRAPAVRLPALPREVYQTAPGELRNCHIGPIARALATHLRYDLQIPYRKVQYISPNLFGIPMVHATAMNFDRKATALGRPLYEQLRIMLQSADTAYADETGWREDGQGGALRRRLLILPRSPNAKANNRCCHAGEPSPATLGVRWD